MKTRQLFILLSSLLFINITIFYPAKFVKAAFLSPLSSQVSLEKTSANYSVIDNQSYIDITVSVKPNSDIANVLNKALTLARDNATVEKPYYITVPKGSYQLSKTIKIYSNTHLFLDGVSLKRCFSKGAMLKCGSQKYSKPGYDAYQNISVNGGTFDGNCANGPYAYSSNTFSMLRFGHARNISLNNITLCNNTGSHHIELGGVDGAYITNCNFYGYRQADNSNRAKAKEAIQIDIIHSSEIFPSYAPYDDTPCQNISITGCTFKNLSRGIGTHNAVIGIYYNGINITNNTFENIQDQAILASSFKNSNIIDNSMSSVGCGVHFRYMTFTTKGFYLPNEHPNILYLDPVANTTIANNTISATPGSYMATANESSAIYIEGSNISNSLFDGNYQISHLTIQNNIINAKGNGITLVNTYDSCISNNTITLNSSKNKAEAISQKDSNNNIINFNKIITQ